MTDMCRFDFNLVLAAVFHCNGELPLMHNGNWTADRGSTNRLLSHDGESCFWISERVCAGFPAAIGDAYFHSKKFSHVIAALQDVSFLQMRKKMKKKDDTSFAEV